MALLVIPSEWNLHLQRRIAAAYAADLWVEDVKAQTFKKLGDEDYKGNYLWPVARHMLTAISITSPMSFPPKHPAMRRASNSGADPEVMQSLNNIWKIPEKGGQAGPGHPPHLRAT